MLMPREYSGPRHSAAMSQRPNGRYEYEERPGAPPPDHDRVNDENVMGIASAQTLSHCPFRLRRTLGPCQVRLNSSGGHIGGCAFIKSFQHPPTLPQRRLRLSQSVAQNFLPG